MPTCQADLAKDRFEFFHTLLGAFQRAERAVGSGHWYAQMGGRRVHLHSAGPRPLEQLTPALAHLSCAAGPGDLTVYCWDNRSSGTSLPLLLQGFLVGVTRSHWDWLDSRYELRGFNDERFRSVFRLGPANLLSLFDAQTSTGLYWTEDFQTLPYWELGSPLQTLLNWWAGTRSLQYVHAAAVGYPEGAVLLAGPGGSGKSTTALACLQAGMGYLGDDYCLVSLPAENSPARVYTLYATAKLVGEEDFVRFPELASWVENSQREEADKALLNVFAHRPQSLLTEAPVRAVVIPTLRGGSHSSLHRVEGARALLALAPSTLFQLAGNRQQCLTHLKQLLSGTPCFSLELGSEIGEIPTLLRKLLTDVGG